MQQTCKKIKAQCGGSLPGGEASSGGGGASGDVDRTVVQIVGRGHGKPGGPGDWSRSTEEDRMRRM